MIRRLLPLLLALGIGTPSGAADLFIERAREAGIDFTHVNGMSGQWYMPEIMGAGAALFDFDNDGDLDAFLVQGGPFGPQAQRPGGLNHRLYRNELVSKSGKGELRFTDVTAESGITLSDYGMGAAAGDFDNDGWTDLYVTALGSNQLWRNNGPDASGRVPFTDVTRKTGADDPRWSVPAAFFDFDRDGWLDLYIGNYLNFSFATHKPCKTAAGAPDYCGPVPSDAVPDRLLRNRGDGTFEDVTRKAGIGAEYGPALGVSTADVNGDGWIDVYVANDETPNLLWLNQKNGTFKNDALLSGSAVSGEGKPQASMGVDAGDYDADGDEDLVMDNLTGEGNTLYRNDGTGTFEDVSRASGIQAPSWPFTGFGAAWIDYDNDSRLDLMTVNGAVKVIEEQVRAKDPLPLKQTKQLFRNVGNSRFEETTKQAGPAFALPEVSRGAAFGDVDNDGDTDVLVANNNGPARLLVNQAAGAKWLGLRLVTGKRDALGARVTLERPGAPALWRRARADGSYASANDPRVLFGLGNKADVGKVTVRWPSGRIEEWKGIAAGAYTTLREGEGTAVP